MKLRYKIANGILIFLAVAVTALALVLSYTADCELPAAPDPGATTMKAITYSCYGSPDVLELEIDDLGPLRSPVMLVALTGLFDISGAATTALDRFAPADAAITIGAIDAEPFYDFTQERPQVEFDESPFGGKVLYRTGNDPDKIAVNPAVVSLGEQVTLEATGRDELHSNSILEIYQDGPTVYEEYIVGAAFPD